MGRLKEREGEGGKKGGRSREREREEEEMKGVERKNRGTWHGER